jgi:hypothetical protein
MSPEVLRAVFDIEARVERDADGAHVRFLTR